MSSIRSITLVAERAFMGPALPSCMDWDVFEVRPTVEVSWHLQILIPEAIRCQPAKEAGPGDPFINRVEAITSSGAPPLIAGLAIMAEALR